MFDGLRGPRQGRYNNGPVPIPRRERLKLKHESEGSSSRSSNSDVPPPKLPSPMAAAFSQSWYGQTYEYAAGLALRKHVLEPILQQHRESGMSGPPMTEEPARFLSYYSKGQVVLMLNASGAIHVATVERVTNREGPTLHKWWDADRSLVYTGSSNTWSDWWIRRCTLFDPGCEMLQLQTTDTKRTLGVVYFERNVTYDGKRLTLIRGIRIDPLLNSEAIRRSSRERASVHPISYPGVATALLFHVLFASIKFGTEGVAVNSPKDDHKEQFYERHMGMAESISPVDGRRLYCVNAEERFGLLRKAFGEQINFMLAYNDQLLMQSGEQIHRDEVEESVTPALAAENEGAVLPIANNIYDISQQQEQAIGERSGEQSPPQGLPVETKESHTAQGEATPLDGTVTDVQASSREKMKLEAGSFGEAVVRSTVGKEAEKKPVLGAATEQVVQVPESKDKPIEDIAAADEQATSRCNKPEYKEANAVAVEEKAVPIDIIVQVKEPSAKRALENAATVSVATKRQKAEDSTGKAQTIESNEAMGGIFDDPDDPDE